jgi:hypothetical protein
MSVNLNISFEAKLVYRLLSDRLGSETMSLRVVQ